MSSTWSAAGRLLFSLFSITLAANAGEVLLNGGFESGLTSWVSSATDGAFFATANTFTPLNGYPTVGAFAGTQYAVSDAFGPGDRALTQTFLAPVGLTSAILSFEMFVNDVFGESGSGGRVDLLAAGADPLTGVALATFYSADTPLVDGVPNPYVLTSTDISSFLVGGTSYQLRIFSTDSTGPINVGVDSVSLNITANAEGVPEPSALFSIGVLLAGGFTYRLRRRVRG